MIAARRVALPVHACSVTLARAARCPLASSAKMWYLGMILLPSWRCRGPVSINSIPTVGKFCVRYFLFSLPPFFCLVPFLPVTFLLLSLSCLLGPLFCLCSLYRLKQITFISHAESDALGLPCQALNGSTFSLIIMTDNIGCCLNVRHRIKVRSDKYA